LVITLNKALAQCNPGYKRIGIMGMLALLQQEGATYELLCDADGSAAGAQRRQGYNLSAALTSAEQMQYL
jgi:hypothetical protein